MTAEIVQEILKFRERLESLRQSSIERLQKYVGDNDARFDLSAEIPGVSQSISEIDKRLSGIAGLLGSLEGIEDFSLAPRSFGIGLRDHLQTLVKLEEALHAKFEEIDQNGGAGNLDSKNFTLQSKNDQATLDLKQLLGQFPPNTDNCLQHYFLLAPIVTGEGYQDFSRAFQDFSRQLKTIRKDQRTLAGVLAEATKHHEQIGALYSEASDITTEIERMRGETDSERKTVSEHLAETTQKIASVREVSEDADKLKSAVQAYQAQFDDFQAQLDARAEKLKAGQAEQDRLTKRLGEIETEIERLNNQAEAMLTGATVAGLASEFGALRNQLTTEVRWARFSFYAAFVILFVSALPLAVIVVPGLGEHVPGLAPLEMDRSSSSPWDFLGQVLVRAILLLPGAWLAKFTAGRHAALFRLREHYSYKYSVAASVEGFKKQAEPFADEIAAATFFELTSNPADRMEGRGRGERGLERHPNPAMEWVMTKLGFTQDGQTQ